MCTTVLIGWDPTTPPPPPAFGLIYEGHYWSAKIDDISFGNAAMLTCYNPATLIKDKPSKINNNTYKAFISSHEQWRYIQLWRQECSCGKKCYSGHQRASVHVRLRDLKTSFWPLPVAIRKIGLARARLEVASPPSSSQCIVFPWLKAWALESMRSMRGGGGSLGWGWTVNVGNFSGGGEKKGRVPPKKEESRSGQIGHCAYEENAKLKVLKKLRQGEGHWRKRGVFVNMVTMAK